VTVTVTVTVAVKVVTVVVMVVMAEDSCLGQLDIQGSLGRLNLLK
jgi:hypothetical protein